VYVEILIVVALTLCNGLLSMSELAVVSSRPARLKVMAAGGSRGAQTALELAQDPGKFLSSAQVGITLVGVLSGAFSGATLGQRLTEWLMSVGLAPGIANAVGVGSVVVIITYLSLIIGELVPKQLALRDPEMVASRIAPLMKVVAIVAAPLVWLLDRSSRLVLIVIGRGGKRPERLTDEEVKTIIAEAETAGVLETEERNMISGVMRLADRSARGLMTPRPDVEIIDLADDIGEILDRLRTCHHTLLPVQDGDPDDIIGVLDRKDFIGIAAEGGVEDLRARVVPAPVILDRADALSAINAIRAASMHMALVFDEYGHFEGIVTAGDVLEAITGAFHDDEDDEPAYVAREDGSYLVSGWMPVDEFADTLGVPVPRDARFETVAGFVLDAMRHLPGPGETFAVGPWRFEVVDLDGRRIDKVIVKKVE
jgi:putative hemolysin